MRRVMRGNAPQMENHPNIPREDVGRPAPCFECVSLLVCVACRVSVCIAASSVYAHGHTRPSNSSLCTHECVLSYRVTFAVRDPASLPRFNVA